MEVAPFGLRDAGHALGAVVALSRYRAGQVADRFDLAEIGPGEIRSPLSGVPPGVTRPLRVPADEDLE